MNWFKKLTSTLEEDDIIEYNRRETQIAKIEQQTQNWNIPKESKRNIYQIGTFDLANDYVIDMTEVAKPVDPTIGKLELFNEATIEEYKKKYKYLHIGMV